MLSPVILFTFNRPFHTLRTIQSLQLNELASSTDLFIYSDAAYLEKDFSKVRQVREILESVSGFKSISLIYRNENLGLTGNILDGVTSVITRYGKAIVLEDDLVVGKYFLNFMNSALDEYVDKKDVWHVSGWNYPMNLQDMESAFLWRVMNCWGWATWADRWIHYKKNPIELVNQWSKKDKYQFDLDGVGRFWEQIQSNFTGEINTWAVFWYATIFQHKGLCLNPAKSFVQNIGHDGTGVNCHFDKNEIQANIDLNDNVSIKFPTEIKESYFAVLRIKDYLKKSKKPLWRRSFSLLKRLHNKLIKQK